MPEPSGYWPGPMHGDTPTTVKGAEVIDADKLAEMKAKQEPVMIDVANMELKPKNFPSNMIWDPRHLSVPGATWMPGAGSGRTDPGFDDAFKTRLQTLTGGDKDRPVVTFCHPKRWGSWNAAKRAAALGYTHVYWMPSGAEGWQEHNAPKGVQADPGWRASCRKCRRTRLACDRNRPAPLRSAAPRMLKLFNVSTRRAKDRPCIESGSRPSSSHSL